MSAFWNSPLSLPLRMTGFVGWFIGQFVITSLQVVLLIMIPGRRAKPGIVRLEMKNLSDAELTILIAFITITPDTLVIAVDREAKSLFVHGMFVDGNADDFREALGNTQNRLIRGLRARPEVSKDAEASR